MEKNKSPFDTGEFDFSEFLKNQDEAFADAEVQSDASDKRNTEGKKPFKISFVSDIADVPETENGGDNLPYSYRGDGADESEAYEDVYGDTKREKKNGTNKTKSEKKKLALKITACVLAILLLLSGVGIYFGYDYLAGFLGKLNQGELENNEFIDESLLTKGDGVYNLLVIGVDARKGEIPDKTRSDTMILVTLDSKNKQIKMTSFLRDTFIQIPGYREDKINAAQPKGGTQLLVDTIEYNFHVDIDSYVLISFDMFKQIIDKLGGVNVEVTEKEAKYINKDPSHLGIDIKVEAGENVLLNGEQALWYARIRKLDSDFQRTKRQRKVVSAVIDKAKTKSLSELMKIGEELIPMVQTSLKPNEIMKLARSAFSYIQYDIFQQSIPANGTWENGKRRGQDVLLIDLEKNRDIVQHFIFDKQVSEEETTTAKKK